MPELVVFDRARPAVPSSAELWALLVLLERYPHLLRMVTDFTAGVCLYQVEISPFRWGPPCGKILDLEDYLMLLEWDGAEHPRCFLHICSCVEEVNPDLEQCFSCLEVGCSDPLHPDVWCKCDY